MYIVSDNGKFSSGKYVSDPNNDKFSTHLAYRQLDNEKRTQNFIETKSISVE